MKTMIIKEPSSNSYTCCVVDDNYKWVSYAKAPDNHLAQVYWVRDLLSLVGREHAKALDQSPYTTIYDWINKTSTKVIAIFENTDTLTLDLLNEYPEHLI